MASVNLKAQLRAVAEAVYADAQQKGTVADWLTSFEQLADWVQQDDIATWLHHPQIDPKLVVAQFFKRPPASIGKQLIVVLNRLAQLRLLSHLPALVALIRGYDDIANRRLQVTLVTAYPLVASQKKQIETMLERHYQSTICLHVTEDARLLGGITLKIGDQFIDASIFGKIQRMAKQLAVPLDERRV